MRKILSMIAALPLVLMPCTVTAETPSGNESGVLEVGGVHEGLFFGESVEDDCMPELEAKGDDLLSTTLLGKLEPSGEPRLAVRWNGPTGSRLDVWADLDGDGCQTMEEMVEDGWPLEPGIEVIDLEIPQKLFAAPQPRLSVRTRHSPALDASPGSAKVMIAAERLGCGWRSGFSINNLDNAPQAFAVFDDGNGDALYVGGNFIVADSVTMNYIAKWNGQEWSALAGPLGVGLNYRVQTLAVFDDGTGEALYVGGRFTTAGGIIANRIAKWDGTSWSALDGPSDTGMNGNVHALAVYDDGEGSALYAGGDFTTAGGVTVNHVAKWDSSGWSGLSGSVGTGVSDVVRSLVVFDEGDGEALFAGGDFIVVGGKIVNCVAKWDGISWSGLSGPSGVGMENIWNRTPIVYALAVYDDGAGKALYAGGEFYKAGGISSINVAKWDGVSWSAPGGALGTGMSLFGDIFDLTVYDDGTGEALYAGGHLVNVSGSIVNNILKWDGTVWSVLGGPSDLGMNSDVYTLAGFNDGTGMALYAGGFFTMADGTRANYIARWDGASWSAFAEPSGTGLNGAVLAQAVYDDGTGEALYVGGSFIAAGEIVVNGIAKWNGTSWSALSGPSGIGIDGYAVYTLAVYDDGSGEALYAGGRFEAAGGVVVKNIAKWDGIEWIALSGPAGDGVDQAVEALVVFDDGAGPALYAGGGFSQAGGIAVSSIARWDGSSWSSLNGSFSGWVQALAVYDDGTGKALYAGGPFFQFNGHSAEGVVKWDGSEWLTLGWWADLGGDVNALTVFDDGTGEALYAGGEFYRTFDGITSYIAKWDGTMWSALEGPLRIGTSSYVQSLGVHDDGMGSALYAGGWFSEAGGVDVNYVAKWDGNEWSALSGPSGTGTSSFVESFASYDDGDGMALYVGGWFTTAGGLSSSRIAKWMCEDPIFADGFESGDVGQWSLKVP